MVSSWRVVGTGVRRGVTTRHGCGARAFGACALRRTWVRPRRDRSQVLANHFPAGADVRDHEPLGAIEAPPRNPGRPAFASHGATQPSRCAFASKMASQRARRPGPRQPHPQRATQKPPKRPRRPCWRPLRSTRGERTSVPCRQPGSAFIDGLPSRCGRSRSRAADSPSGTRLATGPRRSPATSARPGRR